MRNKALILAALGGGLYNFSLEAAPQRRLSRSALNDLAESLDRTSRATTAKDISERADLMDRAGLYILAQHERMRLLRSDKISSRDFEKIGNTALTFDHVDELAGLANNRRGGLPVSVRLALAGRELRNGQLSRAATYLPANISDLNSLDEGPTRMRGALVASGVYAAQGRMPSSLESLSLVPVAAKSGRVDLGVAQLQRARIAFSDGRLGESLEHLVQLPRSSSSWYPGVIVGAWAAYRLKDYNLALGSLMTLHSPYLTAKFGAESHILEAATLFKLCHFESAANSVQRLRKTYDSMIGSIDAFRRQYGNRFSLVSTVINQARGNRADSSSYPEGNWERVVDGVLSTEPMAEVDRTLVQIQDEQRLTQDLFAKTSDNRFNRALKSNYAQILEVSRREAYRKGMKAGTQRLASMRQEVADALESALAVEVEINTRVRDRLIAGQTGRMKDINFEAEIKKGFEFWPFDGEFWRDETGNYAFATSDVCGDQGS